MNARAPIEVIDSHTAGEPTRVVIAGWPEPTGATIADRRDTMRREQDLFRRAVVLEPRGHDAIVGALLVPPERASSLVGVVFFNDVSYLGMCGHGLIGVIRTLEFLGRVAPGEIQLDTPVGAVKATLEGDGAVTIRNVPAYRLHADVELDVPSVGRVRGDVAWGGNWFFLTELPGIPLELSRRHELLRNTIAIRAALAAAGIFGADGAAIDHIECVGPPTVAGANSRNFVLCPGEAYDRSPCGTGTSAHMAALYARGELAIGQRWTQESIVGSVFTGWLEAHEDELVPHIRGNAYVTGRSTLMFDRDDPFHDGLR